MDRDCNLQNRRLYVRVVELNVIIDTFELGKLKFYLWMINVLAQPCPHTFYLQTGLVEYGVAIYHQKAFSQTLIAVYINIELKFSP